MGEWGKEEQLISFAEEGETMLDNGSSGARLPRPEGIWVDVLERAQRH